MERIDNYVKRHELDARTIRILYEHGHLSDEFSEVGESVRASGSMSSSKPSSQGKSPASKPLRSPKDLQVFYEPDAPPPAPKPLRSAKDLQVLRELDEPVMVRGVSEDADAIASDGSLKSEPQISRDRVYRVGNGKSYHQEGCHHLRRIETKGNVPLFLCSCIKIRGVGRDLDLHLADDRSLPPKHKVLALQAGVDWRWSCPSLHTDGLQSVLLKYHDGMKCNRDAFGIAYIAQMHVASHI